MKNINILAETIIREPIFTLDKYRSIPLDPKDLDQFIDQLFKNKIFSEAVYLSSPSLYQEWEKVVLGEKERGKMNESILKYYLRSFSNTVPFGLFTTYSISPKKEVCKNSFTRFSNLDLEYLATLIDHLNKNQHIRKIVSYRKNNSLYEAGDSYRYIEPQYANNNLSYTLSSLERDELLDLLFSFSTKEMSFFEIKDLILDSVEGVSEEGVEIFINQLIESKFYLSCFEICLNEEDLLGQLLKFYYTKKDEIDKQIDLKSIFICLEKIHLTLKQFDENIFNDSEQYSEIYSELDKIGYPFDKKYVINSNLRKNSSSAFHQDELDKKINSVVELLSKLSHTHISNKTNLDDFKINFYNRYENQEVALLTALDNESGIGYLSHLKDDVIFSDLIDDVTMPGGEIKVREAKLEPAVYNFWLNLFVKNTGVIDLKKENLDVFETQKKVINGTFPITYSYYNEKIYLKHAGGFSGCNLLGRFSNNDKDVMEVMQKISDFEADVFKNQIAAEIVHLPMNRAGNILIRKVNRSNEISVISKTSDSSNTIDLNDLTICVKGNRIILKSIKKEKEILPFLSSSQNYHFNSLPVYQFLCDLQAQERFTNLTLNFGGFAIGGMNHFPRLIYGEDIILQKAYWLVKRKDFVNANNLHSHLTDLQIPRFFYLTSGGEDKMIMDMENANCLNILYDEIHKNKVVTITECIYDMESDRKEFANEFISILQVNNHKKEALSPLTKTGFDLEVKRNFIFGDEWVYFKIYTGRVIAEEILIKNISAITSSLLKKQVIDKWFFLRFSDPDFHIRLRMHLTDVSKYDQISAEIYQQFKELEQTEKVWRIDLSTYKRELERYFRENIENSETIFFIDSKFTINLLNQLKAEKNNRSWFFILKSIDDFFTAFNINIDEKNRIMNRMFTSFWIEHGSKKSIKKDIDVKFRKYEKELEALFLAPPESIKSFYEIRLEELKQINFGETAKKNLPDLIWSYIHMHVNRFIISNPRFHELIMYGLLEKQYRKEIGIKKYHTKSLKNEAYKTI